jgi:hypothetical protein
MTGLNRAGYYRWRVPRTATPVEMEIRDGLQQVALESPAYGYRRITAELQRFGRAAVPLVLVFPPERAQPPIILPEFLRPGLVLDALDKAAAKLTTAQSK